MKKNILIAVLLFVIALLTTTLLVLNNNYRTFQYRAATEEQDLRNRCQAVRQRSNGAYWRGYNSAKEWIEFEQRRKEANAAREVELAKRDQFNWQRDFERVGCQIVEVIKEVLSAAEDVERLRAKTSETYPWRSGSTNTYKAAIQEINNRLRPSIKINPSMHQFVDWLYHGTVASHAWEA